jgi:ABC-type nitrate/sulfonate/bicarbonate transport system ATPase subunit
MTARDNVALGVDRVFPRASRGERSDTVQYFLELVGLGDSMDKMPTELSLGMQQRVGLARAFAVKPKMLLLDEPFGMLDSLTRMELQEILARLLEGNGMTALMVTHDVDEALFLADRIVMMTNGPKARVGQLLTSRFSRPRSRQEVLTHPDYYTMREEMIRFLEEQDEKKRKAA